jgi:hypothetical protein
MRDAPTGLRFSPAFVVLALGSAGAAEVRTKRDVAQLDEGLRQSLHDLVVERAAVEGMRVSDQSHAARLVLRKIDRCFDSARAALDENALAGAAHMRRRSTPRPAFTCSSMISSMSVRST